MATRVVFATTAVLALVTACAGQNRPRACDPVPVRYLTMGGPVYQACAVDKPVTPPPPMRVPPDFRPTQSCGRVEIEFVVDSTGWPVRETAQVVRSNDAQLAQLLMAHLTDQRYGPAIKNGVPVRQLTRMGQRYSVTVVAAGTPRSVARGQAPRC